MAPFSRSTSWADFCRWRQSRTYRSIHFWRGRRNGAKFGLPGEYAEVFCIIAAVTLGGWFLPLSYQALGHIYLLAVIVVSVRLSRGPALMAAVTSAIAWNCVFIPPRFSFRVVDSDDLFLLGIYFTVALIGGQMTSHLREQARRESRRQRQSSALFQLTQAFNSASSFDQALRAAVEEAHRVFEGRTALIFVDPKNELVMHPASTLPLSDADWKMIDCLQHPLQPTGRFTAPLITANCLALALDGGGHFRGAFAIELSAANAELTDEGRDLLQGFAAQVALLFEREKLRESVERETLLVESQRLQRTLLDNVSHELKTPLSVLRSAGEQLSTTDLERVAKLAAEVRVATSRLDRVVANLLSQSSLDARALTPHFDWCDAHDLFSSARQAVGESLEGHPFSVEIAADMPLIMADALLMEQVLTNLLFNACRYTPREAPIRLRASVDISKGKVFLSVEDGGPGIPTSLRANLFKKFQRGANAQAGGLGLGLSIARGLILAHGGEVEASVSSLGGANFTLSLPFVANEIVAFDEH